MKQTLFISILLGLTTNQAMSETAADIKIENSFHFIVDDKDTLTAEQPWFEHRINNIETSSSCDTLNVHYNGVDPAAKSIITIAGIKGTGDLILEGTSTNTLKLFQLAENATAGHYGNLTICNYSAAWDGAEIYDNAAVLELNSTEMSGSISLDAAGYCTADCFFISALGICGDCTISGLDAPDYIAPAAYLYSGNLKADTTSLEHAEGFASYITRGANTLTINTSGQHHFHGTILSGITIEKKGNGIQSFTGNIENGSHFHVLGGTLKLHADTEAAGIIINAATLNHTGSLSTETLKLTDATLSVTETLNTGTVEFAGCSTLSAAELNSTSWEFMLHEKHQQTAALTLETTGQALIQSIGISYNKPEMLRGWYRLIENKGGLRTACIQANGNPAQTETRDNSLWVYVADGHLTLPRNSAANLTWLPASGNWQTGCGHHEFHWDGPASNSNFQPGDNVIFNKASEVTLVGELLPGRIEVSHNAGSVSFTGSGSICGAATLSKSGTGELVISTANSYTGGTTLSAGTLTTGHASALGSGAVHLQGGCLNLGGQASANSVCINADAEILGGDQYAGQLVLNTGTLRGEPLHLNNTALLNGGTVEATLTGKGSVQIAGQVNLNAASSYTGSTTITSGTLTTGHAQALGHGTLIMPGGCLNLAYQAVSNTIQIRGEATIQHADNFKGDIDLQNGCLTTGTLGNATLSCSGPATLRAEGTLSIHKSITNTGQLTLEGDFDLTALGSSLNAVLVDASGTPGGTSGFQRDAGTSIKLTNGAGTINGNAVFTYRGNRISLDPQGQCTLGATTHYGQYHIAGGHSVAVSDIRTASGNKLQLITMNGGRLSADTDATIAATGGEIMLTAGTLEGTCSQSTIHATGGTLQLSFSGDNQVTGTSSVRLCSPISNSGNLTLAGEFDVSALPLQTQAATRIGGSSPASGFAQEAACSLQVVNGGKIQAGATMIHGTQRLTLGSDGYATAGGAVDYREYLLTGTDTARLSEIQHPELQSIRMTGGTLTVDTATGILNATAGTVILENGTLSSEISGSARLLVNGTTRLTTANTHSGGTELNNADLTICTARALGNGSFQVNGTSSLTAEGFTMKLLTPIANSGHLTLRGSFDVGALASPIAGTMVDAYGNEGGSSGFTRASGYQVQLITGGSINTAGASIHLQGQNITPDSTGCANLPGALHTELYTISGNHHVSTADIAMAAGGSMPRIEMNAGELLVNRSTDTLHATGGLVHEQNAHLGGCMSGSTRVEILGDAVLHGANTHNGGTSITGGSLKITHPQALGGGIVQIGSKSRNAVPILDLGNLEVSNEIYITGSSQLQGLENFSGSVTMSEGAELTIQRDDVLNLRKGQKLTLAPGGNTIHGHINMDGGTIVITGGPLTTNGVVNFSKPTTIDLSNQDKQNDEIIILDFPSAYDEEMLDIILPEHLQDKTVSFNPQTGTLQLTTEPDSPTGNNSTAPAASLAHALSRNQRSAYEALRSITPESTTGELAELARTVSRSEDISAMRELMDQVNGAGYTSLVNSVADDAFTHMEQLQNSIGCGHRLSPEHNTTVAIHAFNHTGSTKGAPGYDRSTWGGRIMAEQQINPDFRLGISLSSGSSRITPEKDDTHTDTTTHIDTYAQFTRADWNFTLIAGMNLHEFSLSRQLPGGHSAEIASVSGNSINLAMEISRNIPLRNHAILQPYSALRATSATVDSFSESGSTAALHADEQHASLYEMELGMRYNKQFRKLNIGLHGALILTMGNTETELNLHFSDAPDRDFSVYGAKRDSLGYRLGISLSLPLSPACSLQADATARLQSHTQNFDSQIGIFMHF